MKKVLKVLAALVALVLLALGGVFMWAGSAADARMAVVFETHRVDVPSPMPLSEAELEALRLERTPAAAGAGPDAAQGPESAEPVDVLAGIDLDALAQERALARAEHLVKARFGCAECHGADFGGGVMVDDPAMGQWLGANLTGGQGSKTKDYTFADWDRIVRHGVKPDGTPAIMPSTDFIGMSDQELSDIVLYIQSFPPVDADVAPVSFGPIGRMLVATGSLPLSADDVPDHQAAHSLMPPEAAETVGFGEHIAQGCTGCHRADLSGGPIAAGPPGWPPAANLTPGADGLEGWTYAQFDAALLTGVRPDGAALKVPMTLMIPFAKEMTEVEKKALWMYLQSVAPAPTGT